MKNSHFKLAEILLQSIPILFLVFSGIIIQSFNHYGFGVFYFAGGFIQIISLLIHLGIKKHWKNLRLRKIYSVILISFGLILSLLSLGPYILIGLYGLLFISPFLYIFYFIISINEYKMAKIIEEKGFLQI